MATFVSVDENDPLLSASNGESVSSSPAGCHDGHPLRKIHRISYTPRNHIQVLFQMHGSALPSVMPFCLTNMCWTICIWLLQKFDVIDLTFKSYVAHSFMGLLVSFLIVARSRISYQRFMEIRHFLGEAYRSCRELIQFCCCYTCDESSTEKAIQWRQQVAFRTILLLRVTMDALHWSSTQRNLWETLPDSSDIQDNEDLQRLSKFKHGTRTLIDVNFRASILYSYILRETIMEHKSALGCKMNVNEYRDLLLFVTAFNKAFHGLRAIVFTPYPFPLVQMTRMFLFFWVYSLPLVLLEQLDNIWNTLLIVFLITFGFIGTEYVSMTLNDPFGTDANDIDERGLAEMVYEDIYLTIYKADGRDSAAQLRSRIQERYDKGSGLDNYASDVRRPSFWSKHTSKR